VRIESQILQIGFDQRRARLQHVDEGMFALDRTVDNLIHCGGWCGECLAYTLRGARYPREENFCECYRGNNTAEDWGKHSDTYSPKWLAGTVLAHFTVPVTVPFDRP